MNVIMAMNFGADDFIAKPFDGGVLMAKVQAMLRRSYDMAAPAVLRERRGAQLSADDQKLTYQGQTVELTKNEYRILSCLMESAGKVVSREKLMQRLWETDSFVDENTLTVNVNRLRRKLAGVGLVDFIATRHGWGTSWSERYGAAQSISEGASADAGGISAVCRGVCCVLCPVRPAAGGSGLSGRAVRSAGGVPCGVGLRPRGTAAQGAEASAGGGRGGAAGPAGYDHRGGADCAAVVETLRRELCRQETARAARWEDMTAYYTAWVHQIKTPIAAMRLTLQGRTPRPPGG